MVTERYFCQGAGVRQALRMEMEDWCPLLISRTADFETSVTELMAKINAAIAQIRSDGTYEAISAKYFDFNIYGD